MNSDVLVFLGSYNGDRFISAQLDSLTHQTMTCDVVVSDDGSTDKTRSIVEGFVSASNRIKLIEGPKRGFVANFLSALTYPKISSYRYLAFCDQDDIWHPDKLERSVKAIRHLKSPALFGSATNFIDEKGEFISLSDRRPRRLSFRNALVQSFAGGNTFLINQAAVSWLGSLYLRLDASRDEWVSHDWMIYQLMTMAEHPVIYDETPTLLYRQHARNLVGENRSIKAQLRRFFHLCMGRYNCMILKHFRLLNILSDEMTPNQRAVFNETSAFILAGFFKKFLMAYRQRVFRQSLFETIGMYASFLFFPTR